MKTPAFAVIALCLAAGSAHAMENFVLEDEVALCTGCHGEEGIPIEPDYPIIFGQQYFYIYTQLRDYAAGRRQHEIMTDIAAQYDRDQAKASGHLVCRTAMARDRKPHGGRRRCQGGAGHHKRAVQRLPWQVAGRQPHSAFGGPNAGLHCQDHARFQERRADECAGQEQHDEAA